jgi:hypothetical protein
MNLTKVLLFVGIIFSLITIYLSYKEFKNGSTSRENFKKIILSSSIAIILMVFVIGYI